MALRNCDECNRIFDGFGGGRRCQRCLEEEEAQYKKVRDYVKLFPGVDIALASAATEVPEDRIRHFLRTGLLEAAGLSGSGYPCRRCQREIVKGEFCPQCVGATTQELSDSVQRGSEVSSRKEDYSTFVSRYRGAKRF
ncbi:MAG: hypothetical protein ABI743_01935 [bacterium]